MVKKGRRSSVKPAKLQTSQGRRRFLKTAAVTAGAAATTGAIDGFPLVWSQNIKDITLVHVGGSYSAIIDIAKKAKVDTVALGAKMIKRKMALMEEMGVSGGDAGQQDEDEKSTPKKKSPAKW